MGAALAFDGVSKSFAHHTGSKLLRDRLAEMFRPSGIARFEALKDVSFELMPGESMGLVGHNGAGKSTLLNLATGLTLPDSGHIRVDGRVAPLLELGAGFHPDLTGAENVRINAAMMGLSRRQTAERFEEILEFSGVREFIHEPLRTYSSGMNLRLAFSVVVHSDSDIFLVDEVIGAGDEAFRVKCLDKIRAFQQQGKTLLMASHSAALVTTLCERALWLDHGTVAGAGPAAEILAKYTAAQSNAAPA
jgi:ABC-2 type transport system ATP-binding protein